MTGNAIIWDFDGTLVDSRQKNFSVNRALIAHVSGRPADSFPLLRSQEQFEAADAQSKNWREFYGHYFRMTEAETNEGGRLFTEYQLRDDTPTPVFPGVDGVLDALNDLPQGIVSQNSQAMIRKTMAQAGLDHTIGAVIGYEEVPDDQQKPSPAGLLRCLQKLTELRPGTVFCIGNFETDILQAVQAQEVIRQKGLDIKIVTVGVYYGGMANDGAWNTRPDHSVEQPGEIIKIVRDTLGR